MGRSSVTLMSGVSIVVGAFAFAPAHNALTGQWASAFRYDRVLPFLVISVVEVQNHPIIRAAELVGAGRVRVERRKVPAGAVSMQDGEPRLMARI